MSPDFSRIVGNWMLRLLDAGGWFLNLRWEMGDGRFEIGKDLLIFLAQGRSQQGETII